jgi:polyhydroxyalkanoate synthesis regulator phasin
MTPQQNLALTIHDHSTHGTDTLRDSDLIRLAEVWPGLRRVFEEVQCLRQRVEALEEQVATLEIQNTDLRHLLDD